MAKVYGVLPVVTAVPAAPSNLRVNIVTSTSIELEADVVAEATSYTVYIDGVPSGTSSFPSFLLSGLTPSTQYSLAMQASNVLGASAVSDPILWSTAPNEAPVWDETPLDATVGVAFSLSLDSICEDLDTQNLTYLLVSNNVPGLGLSPDNKFISGTPTTQGAFSMTIRASDGFTTTDGTLTFNVALVDTNPPSTVPNLQGTVAGSTVSLTWDAASDAETGIRRYRVRRDGNFLAYSTTLSYQDTGVPDGTYTYTVKAEDFANFPAQGNISTNDSNAFVAIVTTAPQAPDTPVSLAAVLVAGSQDDLTVSWAAGPNGAAPTSYELNYSIESDGGSASGPWQVFPTVGAVTQVTHSNLPTGRVWYKIRAFANGLYSSFTSTIVKTIGSARPPADFIIPRLTGGNPTTLWDGSVNRVPLTGGSARPVQAGDTIEFEAGNWNKEITIQKAYGNSTNWVTFRAPASGQVVFRPATASANFLVTLKSMRYVIFDGETTSSSVPITKDGKRHGFKCTYSNAATTSNKQSMTAYVKFKGQSTNPTGSTQVDSANYTLPTHMLFRYWHFDGGWVGKADGSGAASSSLSTDAGHIAFDSNDHNYKKADFPNQWNEDLTFEHFLAENLGGEATYFGTNPYETYRGTGSEAGGPSCPLRYIKVRHFMTYNTGGQSVQLKSVLGGFGGGDEANANSVHDGVIINATMSVGPDTNGFPALVANSGKIDVYNMWIEGCGGGAIQLRIGDGTHIDFPDPVTTFKSRVYNNVIVDCNRFVGNPLIQCQNGAPKNGGPTTPSNFKSELHVFCNTVVRSPGGPAIQLQDCTSATTAENNILADTGAVTLDAGTARNNTSGTAASLLVDSTGTYLAGNINLRLASAQVGSAVVKPTAGQNKIDWAANVNIPLDDYDHVTRSASSDKGAYEF